MEKLSNHRHIAEHFPGMVQSRILSLVVYLHLWLLPLIYSQKVTTSYFFYFIYLHVSKSHLHVSKSLFIYLPLLQTTVYEPHPSTELPWCHFIKKDVNGHMYASITPQL
jgi:hypothetical protein